MAHYHLVIQDFKSGDVLQSLTEFSDFSIEFKLDSPAGIQNISIDGRSGPQIDDVTELATDLVVYRDGTKIYRGRIHYTQDNLGPNNHTVNITSQDYRALLNRRIFWVDKAYVTTDQSDIAWDFINYTQTQTDGGLGITRGSGQTTGRTRDRDYEAGKNIGEALKQLSEVTDGFEYEVDPELAFNLYYPERGTTKDFVLEYGGKVRRVVRTVSSADFANAVRGHGDEVDDTTPAPVAERFAANLSTAPEGRWEHNQWFTDVIRQTTVDDKTDYELQTRSTIRPSYSMLIREGSWNGPDDLWLGDTAPVVVKSGRLNIVQNMRVRGVTMSVTQDDEESVWMEMGREPPTFENRVHQVHTRLSELERY